ncbi:Beta-galactosidase 8 [Salvia divinorum]|uniref:Beta-galactosidase 8 n=1 Tax=Salvia divinorum TaxID=28513 RepID=A0ABD1FUS9_SALDI
MEIMWLRRLLTEIGFSPNRKSKLFCDNKAAISISENPVQHDKTKHVEVDRHFIKEKLEVGIIEFSFVRSEEQLTDILTKAVNPRSFKEILAKLNIGDTTAQLERECQEEHPNG